MAIAPPRTRQLDVAVLGDLHLGSPECKAAEVLEYLESITPEILVIAGDFIDLDAIKLSELAPKYLNVIKRVLDLSHEGTRVYYLTGNHDKAIRRFGDLALGNLHIRQELMLHLKGRKYYMLHGDVLDAAVKYKLSTNKLGGKTYRLLGKLDAAFTTVLNWIGRKRWSLAKEVQTRPDQANQYLGYFESAAATLAEMKGCDSVICAHVHAPTIAHKAVKSKEIQYLNAGDWVNNLTALEYRFGRWELYRYSPDDFPKPNSRLRVPLAKPGKFSKSTGDHELLMKLLKGGEV